MAISEDKQIKRDTSIQLIQESDFLPQKDKQALIEIISDAAECTNGFTEKQKIQGLSETTFDLTRILASLYETVCKNEDTIQNNLNSNIIKMDEKLDDLTTKIDVINLNNISKMGDLTDTTKELCENKVKCHAIHKTICDHIIRLENNAKSQKNKSFENLTFTQILKLILIKPWVWIFLSVICFSPKGLEMISKIITLIG